METAITQEYIWINNMYIFVENQTVNNISGDILQILQML